MKNKLLPTVEGIGCIGYGHTSSHPAYSIWSGMLLRCYNEAQQVLYPQYKDCSVCMEWHNFQNFANWYDVNFKPNSQLDKDLSVLGNRIYSPETCEFIPSDINTLISHKKSVKNGLPTGVTKVPSGKYRANSRDDSGYPVVIGTFKTPDEASQAYKEYKQKVIRTIADREYGKGTISYQIYNNLCNYYEFIHS